MTVSDGVSGAVEVTKGLNEISKSSLAFSKGAKEALQIAANVGDAITPFIPLIGLAATLITAIVETYHTSQYNKKICNSLLDRARFAEVAIDQLIRRRQENEKNFKSQTWYKAFNRFVGVLGKMKEFSEKVSQLQGINAFFKAKNIAEKFKDLTNDYDNVMKDLNFTMAIANEQQRKIDHESVKHDLYMTNKFLEKIEEGVEKNDVKIALIFEEVQSIRSKMEKSGNNADIKTIDKSNLNEPEIGRAKDSRGLHGLVKRKIYMKGIEVACKPIRIPEKNTSEYKLLRRHLAIAIKATQSPNIIQYYGVSEVDGSTVMVCEWAEYGNLEEYYKENPKIPLDSKLSYALHICRGIAYLNALDIYHHDLRCKNIMITEGNVAKITNFDRARGTNDTSSSIQNRIENGRWLAPEKLNNSEYRYDQKCEIFSFGMLLWELAFEKKPYENKQIDQISDYVIAGHREDIDFGLASPEVENVQKGFEKIIRAAWSHDPDTRISISVLLIELDTLSKFFVKPGSPNLQPQVINNNNDNKVDEVPEYNGLDFNIDSIEDDELEPILPINEGVKFHKARDFEKAWKCFDLQAENNNSLGKYWKAHYLWEGFAGQKDKMTALNLFKEAADDNVVDAQFRYACALLDKDLKLKHKVNPKDAVKYLRLAADNGSGPAQFQIGEAYSKGRLGYLKNLETAILWYRRAAIQNDRQAKEKLKELNIDE